MIMNMLYNYIIVENETTKYVLITRLLKHLSSLSILIIKIKEDIINNFHVQKLLNAMHFYFLNIDFKYFIILQKYLNNKSCYVCDVKVLSDVIVINSNITFSFLQVSL